MWGAIVGDIAGSAYEFSNTSLYSFDMFGEKNKITDDTILTIATMDALMSGKDFAKVYRDYSRRYPNMSYGTSYLKWVNQDDAAPYNSMGNGSAMRVSPVAWYAKSIQEVASLAKKSAAVTHNHPEGIKGAVAIAMMIYGLRTIGDRSIVVDIMKSKGYDIIPYHRSLKVKFDETCPGTVPFAVSAFLDSYGFDDCIRKAVKMGGDSDTIACIAGSLAEAFFGVPVYHVNEAKKKLPKELLAVIDRFTSVF